MFQRFPFFLSLSERKVHFSPAVLSPPTHLPPSSLCSSDDLGPDGATAIAAPLALLTSLQTMDLRCTTTALRARLPWAEGRRPVS